MGVQQRAIYKLFNIGISLCAVFFLCQGIAAAENLRIYCMDVGQGASTVILSPNNEAVIIDTGKDDDDGIKLILFISYEQEGPLPTALYKQNSTSGAAMARDFNSEST